MKQVAEGSLFQAANVFVRLTFVPDYNDNQMDKIVKFLKPLKNIKAVKVLPYHNYAGSKYEALGMKNTLPQILPTEQEIKKAEKVFAPI